MKTIFKVGDKVYDYQYGWGKIFDIDKRLNYPIKVGFGNLSPISYTKDGSEWTCKKPTLSFTEYTLQGFSQERPTLFAQAYNKVKQIINKSK